MEPRSLAALKMTSGLLASRGISCMEPRSLAALRMTSGSLASAGGGADGLTGHLAEVGWPRSIAQAIGFVALDPLEQPVERASARRHVSKRVARAFDALRHGPDSELGRIDRTELGPGQRAGGTGIRRGADRISRRGGAAAGV